MIVIDRRHARVVEVARAMPHTVLLIDAHVTHLCGQEVFERGLPHMSLEHVRVDAEHVGLLLAVGHRVQPRRLDRREVEPQVLVPQEASPLIRLAVDDRLCLPVRADSLQYDVVATRVARIELDHNLFRLLRVITDLRYLHDRRAHPVFGGVWRDEPFDRAGRRLRGNERADDEPSIVVIAAAVMQLELTAANRRNREVVELGFGRDLEAFTAGERPQLIRAVLVDLARARRLAREDGFRRAELKRASEQQLGEELQIEADFADPRLGHGLVHVDDQSNRFAFRNRSHGIGELEIGIHDRIESFAVPIGIRIRELHRDLPLRSIDLSLAGFWDRRPLSRRRLESYIAVRGDALVVHEDAETALMAFGVVILTEHHVDAVALEVLLLVEREGVGCDRAGEWERQQQDRDESSHRVLFYGFWCRFLPTAYSLQASNRNFAKSTLVVRA